ncbi:MAG: hypothetical protein KBT21_07480 [Treponema sp.]|nr:hypothetical protein [Candidatus Treponema merdequi]
MRVLKYRKRITFLLVILAMFACACRSTRLERRAVLEQTSSAAIDKDDKEFSLYENDDLLTSSPDDKYIFFRLYQPQYDNPLCVENILKVCIGSVDVAEEPISHSAIGFTLNDCFYGLTTAGKTDLKIEVCTDTHSNPYMKKCNKYKSVQTTYAIKVTEEEYEKAKKLVEDYYNNPKTKYDVSYNFKMAGHGIRRKFFLPEEQKKFGGDPQKTYTKSFAEEKYNFVCSSFIAYVLANSLESVKNYFVEKQIDVDYVMPSDLAELPGAVRLFKSTWVDYSIAAKQYSSYYVCLAPFYKEYLAHTKKEK